MSSFRHHGGGACGGDVSLTVPLAPTGPPAAGPAEVRFAGVDTKEKMYEPKQQKKLVRVLTVVAYLFFVSLAAAMLSLYYVFLWNPSHSRSSPKARQLSDDQLRQREQVARRELQNIQDQLRLNEQLRLTEQLRLREQQRMSLELQAWPSTPSPRPAPSSPDASPDYADFTEAPEEDELYTLEPRVLRHHGLALTDRVEENDGPDNAIPLVPGPGASAESFDHVALRHASQHSPRLN